MERQVFKKKIDRFIKFLGGVAGLVGIVFLFFQWKIGVTFLMAYYFSATVSIWLMDNSVSKDTSNKVANMVKEIINKSKVRGVIFTLVQIALLYMVWFYF